MIKSTKTNRHLLLIFALTAACLLPFTDKAFNIDDPLFVWSARNIIKHPFDFYGFDLNWYGYVTPMFETMKNPPLGSYLIAAVGAIFGFSERAIHTFFIIPACAVTCGTYLLARRLEASPTAALFSALTVLFSPVFLTSASTVMCDVLMVAFWVWAVLLWIRGNEQGEWWAVALAAIFIGLSALSKYFGISLLPLLIAYSLLARHPLKRWLPWLLIPVFMLAAYQLFTDGLYGRGLLLDAASYASNIRIRTDADIFIKVVTGLAFLGGSFIAMLFYTPLVWRRRGFIAAITCLILCLIAVWATGGLGARGLAQEGGWVRWSFILQLAFFSLGGLLFLALTLGELNKKRDAATAMLFLWITGTLLFAIFFNWTINGRSILPAAPAFAVLLWRAVARRYPALEEAINRKSLFLLIPLILAALISMALLSADVKLANSARDASNHVRDNYRGEAATIWFQGHWGFQYYMQEWGARPIDWRNKRIEEGDIAVSPDNSTNLRFMRPPRWTRLEELSFQLSPFATTMVREPGLSGFYSNLWGPAPYLLGMSFPEKYFITYALINNFSNEGVER